MGAEPFSRAALEARLDRLVAGNRFTIAVVFPVVGAVALLASAAALVPPPLRFNPYLLLFGTLVMRLPLLAGVAPLVDRRAALALGALSAYAFAVEYVGVTTGWPYGAFAYGVDLGPMLFGAVPLGLPLFFLPLVLNSYLLCLLLLGRRAASPAVRVPVVVGTVLAVDLVLDPGAVALGFWTYEAPGAYYGVPWSNFAGWLLSAVVAVGLVDVAFDRRALTARLKACPFALDDLVSFVVLWSVVNVAFGNWLAVGVAACLLAGLVRAERVDAAVLRTAPLGGR
ncbi:MAG: bisanhydrobacterioruberin hydratase [Halorientalis sp.]